MAFSQPGVSSQLRQLERELGQPLLDRSGRQPRLTEVGRAVLPHARAALEGARAVRHTVDAFAGLTRGHIAVGTVTAHALDLTGLLADFRREHPSVDIALSTGYSDALTADVPAGRLDLAIVGLVGAAPEGARVQELYVEPLLATAERVTLGALMDRDLITQARGTSLWTALDRARADAGFAPRISFEVGDLLVAAELAAHGLGVAVLPASSTVAAGAGLSVVPIVDPVPRGSLGLLWRDAATHSPAAKAFIRHARRRLPRS
ncbi:MAG TPA: LysR substrate-binding domain-containing protein [Stackebrandtia sp.]|jgi:DNA-binding transcriptional LysR family regulator|uniref:LysR family transcriptional regulator n=1 Tax=Stackebrandtia sp. TaxID=2023065 RepID=UPI002D4DBE6A|nr:LysR substrate-binding domain-containing protein [Stackebrandtia sp.]HZE40655.1 LysR substrate-binding domain-containing protein [Stackebrandtia sp.]